MNMSYLAYLFFLVLIASVYLFIKASASKLNKLVFSILIFVLYIYILLYLIADYFTDNGFDSAVIYHLKYGLSGAGFGEYWKLILASIFYILFGLAAAYWIYSKKIKTRSKGIIFVYAAYLLIIMAFLSNPLTIDLYNYYQTLHPPDNMADFNEFYKQPKLQHIADSKNLVLIYAEGLERTYFDEAIFPGLIKELRELEGKSTYFTNIKTLEGFKSTMGGVVASHCGISLSSPGGFNNVTGMKEFLPSATCLGDLLKQEDYYLTYFGGADLTFAGKGKFYSTHKFDEIYGSNELMPRLENSRYHNPWGLYDDSLFEIAYQRFIELSATEEKHALFLLTFDTHHPTGHPSGSCRQIKYNDGSNPILNAVACSDYLISKFVNQILASPYGSETVVVVVSDHLAMRNTATELLHQGDRKNLFMIISPGASDAMKIENLGSALDIGATILPFMGYRSSIGLGRDLMDAGQTTSEVNLIHVNLPYWNQPISQFWDFPIIQQSVEIDIINNAMSIDGRPFPIPALVQFDDELQTSIKFGSSEDLFDNALSIDKNTFFLLIDKFKGSDYYLIIGKGDRQLKKDKIESNIKLTVDDIINIIGIAQGAPLPATKSTFQVHRVAHAGGGIDGRTYTNSIDALDYNLKNGFSYFEIDFSFTSDGHLACLHDWQENFEKIFGFETKNSLSLESFKSLVNNSGLKNCTLDSLVDWMQKNPSSFIVTDVKDDNIRALQIMAEIVPDYASRIIPQIYYPQNYDKVRGMGYEQIIWTLYRYNATNSHVLWWADTFSGPFAITMPRERLEKFLVNSLRKKQIPFYVHTVNTVEEEHDIIDVYGASEIYTDYLHPKSY